MYAIYGNIYHQYTPNVSIYTIHGSYGILVVGLIGSEKQNRKTIKTVRGLTNKSADIPGHIMGMYWVCN